MSYIWKDMSEADLAQTHEPKLHLHHFSDGQQRRLFTVDDEVAYPDGRMIVSRTDLNGIITHANQAFIDMSGYEREELIGAPQCILRHPDIPSEVFGDLWETIQSGKSWFGYVKNLRKDGRYYWVYASVNPNFRNGRVVAYTSIRRKPARSKINDTIAHIAALKCNGEA